MQPPPTRPARLEPVRGNGPAPSPRVLLATRVGRVAGAERLLLQLVQDLPARGIPVRVTTVPLPWDGDPVPLPVPSAGQDIRDILAGDCDVLHTHLFLPGLLARLRRLWDRSFRWVHTVHYHHYDGLSLPRLRRFLDRRWIFPGTDVLVAVSPAVHETLRHLPQARLVENAIDLSPRPSANQEGIPVVGCVAMLRREKGLETLVRAAGLLRDRGEPVRVEIAGEGPERDHLEALIRELELEDRVVLRGYLSDLDAFYRSVAVYAQPSLAEPFGLAALEALRYRLPVVATAAGHLPHLLGGGRFGRLVPTVTGMGADPDDLARALGEVLSDLPGARKAAEAGLDHWRERLSVDGFADAHARLYRDACAPRVMTVAATATQGGGGLQRQVHLQTRALAASGHRVLLLQRSDPAWNADPELRAAWRHLTLVQTPSLRALGRGPTGIRLRGLASTLAMGVCLWRHRRRYDVVYAHQLYSPTLAGILAGIFSGRPLVVRVTSSGAGVGELNELRRLPFTRLRLRAVRLVDRFVALSHTMAGELRSAGFPGARVSVIPNAVAIPPKPDVPPPPGTQGGFGMVFTGRLSTEKSLSTAVRAVAELRDRGQDVMLHLVGGPDPDRNAEPGLRELADDLGVAGCVVFHGQQPDVVPFLESAHAFVLPSLNEGMSNALLEAMARGMVCLVSDIPQNRAVVEPGRSGLLFPHGDASALARLVERLDEDRLHGGRLMRSLGEAARESARARHAPEAVGRALSALFSDVVGGS